MTLHVAQAFIFWVPSNTILLIHSRNSGGTLREYKYDTMRNIEKGKQIESQISKILHIACLKKVIW